MGLSQVLTGKFSFIWLAFGRVVIYLQWILIRKRNQKDYLRTQVQMQDFVRRLFNVESSRQIRGLAMKSSGVYLSVFLLVDATTGEKKKHSRAAKVIGSLAPGGSTRHI